MTIVETQPGYCHCGCGEKTHISRYDAPQLGWVKGRPRKFLSGHVARLRERENLTGQKFGRWTVIGFSHFNNLKVAYWSCRCECGTERAVRGTQLKNGTNRSCSCLQKELAAAKKHTHGLSFHPLKTIYYAMLGRCHNPNNNEYHNYGARGIVVCDRWRNSIEAFITDMSPRPDGYTLDRIDNNGLYSPENCRWATMAEQANNKRVNHIIEFNGKRQNITQWSVETGISPRTIYARIKRGWPVDRIFEPVDTIHHKSQV